MRSFTAKEFSRCPAKVYEAAREDGEVEITHDRFAGKFYLCFVGDKEVLDIVENIEADLAAYIERGRSESQGIGQFIDIQRQSDQLDVDRFNSTVESSKTCRFVRPAHKKAPK